jgi:hypothetical protein
MVHNRLQMVHNFKKPFITPSEWCILPNPI